MKTWSWQMNKWSLLRRVINNGRTTIRSNRHCSKNLVTMTRSLRGWSDPVSIYRSTSKLDTLKFKWMSVVLNIDSRSIDRWFIAKRNCFIGLEYFLPSMVCHPRHHGSKLRAFFLNSNNSFHYIYNFFIDFGFSYQFSKFFFLESPQRFDAVVLGTVR